MSTSDQNQPRSGEGGAGTAAAPQPQAEPGSAERGAPRHGRGRRGRAGGGRHEQQGRQPQQGHAPRRADSALNMDELRELTELFTAHGLTDFEFENADIRIRLSRSPAAGAAQSFAASAPPASYVPQSAPHAGAAGAAAQTAPPPGGAPQPAATPEPPEEELHIIAAEMVGTFYRASSPTSEPFVKVGSQVETGTVVCIIEAMKLMNEIESDVAGTIAKIYVENGQPVEFGQPLFGVKK
jgi:acetyl-CoA carboxylase biotin carboxyl carrier protein